MIPPYFHDEFIVDPNAVGPGNPPQSTGVLVRARLHGVWGNHDIAHLDDESLNRWITSHLDDSGRLRLIRTLLGREP